MDWLFASDWEIVLSVLAPAVVAVLICVLEAHGPLSLPIRKTTGLVGPYFTSVAILFGLFTAQLMTEAWQRESAARQTIEAENNALREILRLTRANDLLDTLGPQIKAYTEAAARENPYSNVVATARLETDKSYQALLTGIVHVPDLESANRTALINATEEMRRARDRTLYLADDDTAAIKWLSILILGALTQIAILLVHIGNPRAIRVSVGLFTVAFIFCLSIVAIFDTPFSGILADEPGATFGRTLQTL